MPVVNQAFKEFFGGARAPPAKSCFAVASLPVQGALVKMESVAVLL
jgi:enamine deaminase RidA (YjgF/YER057c/UK114 family)